MKRLTSLVSAIALSACSPGQSSSVPTQSIQTGGAAGRAGSGGSTASGTDTSARGDSSASGSNVGGGAGTTVSASSAGNANTGGRTSEAGGLQVTGGNQAGGFGVVGGVGQTGGVPGTGGMGSTTGGSSACVTKICQANVDCGTVDDGCGSTVLCGGCPTISVGDSGVTIPLTCGGGGVHKCGTCYALSLKPAYIVSPGGLNIGYFAATGQSGCDIVNSPSLCVAANCLEAKQHIYQCVPKNEHVTGTCLPATFVPSSVTSSPDGLDYLCCS